MHELRTRKLVFVPEENKIICRLANCHEHLKIIRNDLEITEARPSTPPIALKMACERASQLGGFAIIINYKRARRQDLRE